MPRLASCTRRWSDWREVARRACGGAFVEPSLLLGVRRGLTVAGDQREHAEHVVDVGEEMLQRALRLGADGAAVEHAVDVTQPGEDDAHRLGEVEVVVHRLVEPDAHPAHRREHRFVARVPVLLGGVEPIDASLKVDKPLHRDRAVGEQLVRVVERPCDSGSARRAGSGAPRGSLPPRARRARWRSCRDAWPSSRR